MPSRSTASNAGPYRHNLVPFPRRRHQNQQQQSTTYWGQRTVLLLIPIWLGIDGVNPVYCKPTKVSSYMRRYMRIYSRLLPRLCINFPIERHRWRAPIFLLLLGRHAGRQPLLPRPAPHAVHHPAAPAATALSAQSCARRLAIVLVPRSCRAEARNI